MFDPQAIDILFSNIFNWDVFSGPISAKSWRYIRLATIVGILVENLPQFYAVL